MQKSNSLLIFLLFFILHLIQGIDVDSKVFDSYPTNYWNTGVFMLPKKEKMEKGGEDAYYVSPNVISIADGVSQWVDWGVDPAEFPKSLMYYISQLVENATNSTIFSNPKAMLNYAFDRASANGSCTASVMSLDKNLPLIYSGQVGDSGFEILRRVNGSWAIVEEYVSIQWIFNMPFQLCKDPNFGDNPEIGDYRVIKIEHNDVILMATDGIWDNLFDSDILYLFEQMAPDGEVENPKNMAEVLVDNANRLSTDRDYVSPFELNAQQAGHFFTGGKSDDITCIITQVKLII